ERKPRKGQNRIKTGQKREAWRSREKSKAVTVKENQEKDKIGSKPDKNGKRFMIVKGVFGSRLDFKFLLESALEFLRVVSD
nr:hypothetical protein [Tanacetum cinerariifolium]